MTSILLQIVAGLATMYYPGDGHCGNTRADGKPFTATDNHIAHRTIPLGTKGTLCNLRTLRCTYTVVRDRGPFGAIRKCKNGRRLGGVKGLWCYRVAVRDLQSNERYRGEFDVTKPVARAIRMQPFDKLVFIYE
jgi:hypothetical protein